MSWNEATISVDDSDHFETLNGLWKGKKEPFVEAGVIRNTNFTLSGTINYSNVAYLDVEVKQLSKRRLKPGDIILERSGGGPKQPVGRVVFFDREDGEFSFSNFTSAIRVKNRGAFDPLFVFYGLMELYQSGQTADIQRRTTGIRNLDFTAYKKRAHLPRIPLPEQKKIAHILSTVQRAIEAQDRIIQTTTELFKSMLHQLMTAQIRVSNGGRIGGDSRAGQNMTDWKTRPLGDITQFNYGKSLPAKSRISGPIPVYGSNGIIGTHNQPIVDEPGLVIGRKGSAGQVHRSLVPFFPIDTTFYIIANNAPNTDIDFLYYLLLHIDPRRIIGDVGVPGLNREMAYLEKVTFPVLISEQRKIAHILSTIQQKVDNAQSKKSKLQDLFRTMLHELMTAKVRVD